MSEELWASVDRYLVQQTVGADPVLTDALARNAAAGLPAIDVSPTQGKLLYLLAKLHGARRVLEIGTLGGYSTIWMARALLADGRIVTLELEAKHAEIARKNFQAAGVAEKIEVVVGKALDSLAALRAKNGAPFDLAFVDADKVNALEYFQHSLALCRPGALVIVDNVVRKGAIADAASTDAAVKGMRRFLEALPGEKRVEATGLQTVGSKGYDGFVIARVRD